MRRYKVLVTGASGFVGRYLVHRLVNEKLSVCCAMRTDSVLSDKVDSTVLIPSIDAQTDWTDALFGREVVIHLAARVHVMHDTSADPLAEFRKVNVEGTLNLAKQAARAGVKRFIFISSIKVNGEHTEKNKQFTENDKPGPQDAYGISKFEAEQGLLKIAEQTGIEVVIIRPPLVYGAGVKANFASMLAYIKRGIPLPLGAIHNQRSFVYVGNLVSLIICCIDHTAAANQIFMVSDGNDLSTTELLRACGAALGVKARLLSVPQKLLQWSAVLLGKHAVAQRLCGNLQVDITKARTMLGWNPPFTVVQGLKATVLNMDKTNKK